MKMTVFRIAIVVFVLLAVLSYVCATGKQNKQDKEKNAIRRINKLVRKFKSDIEADTQKSYDQFKAQKYRKEKSDTEIALFIKVKVSKDKNIHVKLTKDKGKGNKFMYQAVQTEKSHDDEIKLF